MSSNHSESEPVDKEFLISMYGQMFNNINRHILIIWQTLGVVVGAFALLGLTKSSLLPLDFSVSLIVLLCGWLFSHCEDASAWYNRNHAIICEIENQFLTNGELGRIKNLFGNPRQDNKMVRHFRLQKMLGLGIMITVIMYHLTVELVPALKVGITTTSIPNWLPYLALVFSLYYPATIKKSADTKYQKLIANNE